MIVCSYASLRHYNDHLAPIMDALGDAAGDPYSPGATKPWGLRLVTRPDAVWMVASYADAQRVRSHGDGPIVYVEHGAGQSYPGDPRSAGHGAFSGGDGLDHVGLFICPSETVAARWRARYPEAEAVAVGCPKLDRWHADPAEPPRQLVVAVTWHHSNAQIPEQHPAWTHYRDRMRDLRDAVAAAEGILLGHGHPRAWRIYRDFWRRLGVPCTDDLGEVFDRASLLIGDNTSALPEFASLGRPVLWLNAPWYRRDVDHGGRFWDWPQEQVQCSRPEDLVAKAGVALEDPWSVRAAREAMVRRVYDYTDGRASERAAEAIRGFLRRVG